MFFYLRTFGLKAAIGIHLVNLTKWYLGARRIKIYYKIKGGRNKKKIF